jgi:hypothetical protein
VKIIFPNVLVWKISFAAQLTWEKTPSRGAQVGSREWWRYFKILQEVQIHRQPGRKQRSHFKVVAKVA